MRKTFWWILTALVPAVALAAMTVTPPNLQKALAAQRALVAEHPRDSKVYNDLGNLLVLAGDLEGAETAYRYALELEPSKASTHFNLGLLLQQLGRNREALAEYQRVIEIQPASAWSHYQMGTLYDLWRRDEEAVAAYARAFSLDPQLAFPEINPHVIDNRLLTEALLKASREPRAGVMAPKAYDDPGRIAGLLVPQVPMEEAEMEEGETETAPAEAAEVPEEAPGQGSTRRLTEGDLDRNAKSNQIGAGAPGSVYRPGTTYLPPSRADRRPPSTVQERLEQLRAQAEARRQALQRQQEVQTVVPGTVGAPPAGSGATAGQAPPRGSQGRVEVPAGRPPVRPGVASTGRLEMKLLPVEEPVPAG